MRDPKPRLIDRFDPMGAGPAYPWSNKIERVLWQAVWLLLFRYSPTPFFGWRRMLLRLFGADIAPGVRIHSSAKVWLPRNLTIGARSLIGPGVRLYDQGRIVIGERTVISQYAHLCASSHDVRDVDFRLVERPIRVGSACWIAAEAFVGPGVTVGDGAVLSARGVLFDDVGELEICRGNPAIPIGKREQL